MAKDVTELSHGINETFGIVTSGRPGPVLVDLPKDVSVSILREPLPYQVTTLDPSQSNMPPPNTVLVRKAAHLIDRAERPIIYAGNGVISSPSGPKLLSQLSEQGNLPVTTALQGLGAFDGANEKSLHMLCVHGSAYANFAMQSTDVIIALGARFDDRVVGKVDTFAPATHAAAAQGRGGINKAVEAFVLILGDVVSNLAVLVPLI